MRLHLTLTILFLPLSVYLFSQPIRGIVLDEKSGDPVDYAAVYIDGTFLGTITDEKGEFALDPGEFRGYPLKVSAMGYRTLSLDSPSSDKFYRVLLEQMVFEIKELSVVTRSLEQKRKANLRVFRQEFLGSSNNALKCHILNEDVITFNYEEGWDTLKAYARAPLEIRNDALGYTLTYFLDYFEYDRVNKSISFSGSIVFKEDLAIDSKNMLRIERRRKNTYAGSCQHFFRALWTDDLKKSKFAIERFQFDDRLKYADVVVEDEEGNKYFSYPEELTIYYSTYWSSARFLKPRVHFDHSGYFDPKGIQWKGAMSVARIADWLPYEYQLPR